MIQHLYGLKTVPDPILKMSSILIVISSMQIFNFKTVISLWLEIGSFIFWREYWNLLRIWRTLLSSELHPQISSIAIPCLSWCRTESTMSPGVLRQKHGLPNQPFNTSSGKCQGMWLQPHKHTEAILFRNQMLVILSCFTPAIVSS